MPYPTLILAPSAPPLCPTDAAPATAEWPGVPEGQTPFEQTFQSLANESRSKEKSSQKPLVTGTPAAVADVTALQEQIFFSPTMDENAAEKETIEVDQPQTVAATIPAEWLAMGLVLPITPTHIAAPVAPAAPASDTSAVLPAPAPAAKSSAQEAPAQGALTVAPAIQPSELAKESQLPIQVPRPAMSRVSQTYEDFIPSPQREIRQSTEPQLGEWVRPEWRVQPPVLPAGLMRPEIPSQMPAPNDAASSPMVVPRPEGTAVAIQSGDSSSRVPAAEAGILGARPVIDDGRGFSAAPLKTGGDAALVIPENSPEGRRGELFTSRGMAGAKFTQQMVNAEDNGPVAPSAKQTLPEPATSGVVSADSSVLRTVLPEPLKKAGQGSESVFAFDSAAVSPRSTLPTEEVMVRETRDAEPAAALIRELQSELIHAVFQLKRLRTDSLSVVLRPDANTELELQVNLRGGVVDVDAHFKRGSFHVLQGHWEELQQNLSQQGIRVGPLQEASLGSGFSGQGSTPFRERPTEMEDFIPEPARSGTAPHPRTPGNQTTPLPRTSNDQLWESWA